MILGLGWGRGLIEVPALSEKAKIITCSGPYLLLENFLKNILYFLMEFDKKIAR